MGITELAEQIPRLLEEVPAPAVHAEQRGQLADGSTEKTLHANPGSHFRVPPFEIDSSIRFFTRHLGSPGNASDS